MRSVLLLLLCAACTAAPPGPRVGDARTPPSLERGQLLYENNCAACHTTQAHWRDKRIVKSWPDLIGQVAKWQAVAGQRWGAAEIEDVASYLNERFYRLPANRSAGRRRRSR